jgi:nicotinic acid phosphoribosyltransferase
MKDVVIVTGDKVVRVPRETWGAFLKSAGLVIDSGDMYPLLDKVVSHAELRAVKDLKIELDDHNDSSSS